MKPYCSILPIWPLMNDMGKFEPYVDTNYEVIMCSNFLTAIWLPHGQLWAIMSGKPHPPAVNQCICTISIRRSPTAP